MHALRGFVDALQRTDIELVADVRGKGIVRQRVCERCDIRYVQIVHQDVCERNRAPLCIRNGFHCAERRIRADDRPFLTRLLRRLCLKHGVAVVARKFYDEHDGMILEHLSAIVDIGVGEVECAACTAADVRTWQTLCVVECPQNKGLARAHAVHIDECKGIIEAHGERNAFGTHIGSDPRHALSGGERHLTALHIFVVQRQRHHVGLCDHALAEHLQEHLCSPVPCLHIVRARVCRMRQLTAGCHEQEFHIRRRDGLHGTCNIIHREICRDKAEDDGRTTRHVIKLAQTLCRKFTAREVDGLHIAAPHRSQTRKRGARLHALLTLLRICRKRLRLNPIRK